MINNQYIQDLQAAVGLWNKHQSEESNISLEANVAANTLMSLVSKAITHMPPLVRVMAIVSGDLHAGGN